MTIKNLKDGDYTLTQSACWVALKGFSVRIRDTDDGVMIRVYADGFETDGCLGSVEVLDSERDTFVTEIRAEQAKEVAA